MCSRRRHVIPQRSHPAQVATSYVEEGRPLADGVVEAIPSFVVANRK